MEVLPPTSIQHSFISKKAIRTIQPRQLRNLQCSIATKPKLVAHKTFDEIPLRNTFAWNNLIQSHLSNGDISRVISIYENMLVRGVRPDRHTLPRIVTASRLWGDLFVGRQLHGQAMKLGFSSDQYVVTALIEMYGRLDRVDSAKFLVEKSPHANPVSWTLLSRLYILAGKPNLALDMFLRMVELKSEIDSVALVTATSACGLLKSLQKGRNVHEIARKCGLECDVVVGNSLLKMYIDFDNIAEARAIFDGMPSKDVISWTALIHAYVKNGFFNEGLKLFRGMNLEGLKPDSLSISSILPACARMAEHKHGREIHGYLLRNSIESNLKIQNALMDMYVKSGDIESTSKIFSRMKEKDIISWTVMIFGLSLHGQGELGVELFHQLEKNSNIGIDQTTYAAVLHACSTARMVEQGKFYFKCIREPKVPQYALMVALLARQGLFDEAMSFIEEAKIKRHPEVLRKLLDGFRIHGQSKLGKRVTEQLCDLEPLNAENYVLLSNWYAESAKSHMVDKLRGTIRDMGLKTRKAYTWIVLRNKVHVFGTGDVSHPRSGRIYFELECLLEKMRSEGCTPGSDFSLHDVDEERECIQIGHSEMLALSFGLISTQAGATICLTKNLRVCRSCHDFAKFISKIERREITLKDPNIFHHFKDGLCSCENFW
ncbi:Pentatricopeptide repeat [Quillaja saponaria]|uniref:Pentatricopeptide repeat n=1 Tax=Quillaja saponaria TaxID=32244 RepID=A0AAD7L2Y6_QUISA|nr:Pentatricopeptide repeat [Quillaja saponaria]